MTKKSKSRGCFRRFVGFTFGCGCLTLLATVIVFIVGSVAGWWAYDTHVVREPGSHIERSAIMASIAQESTVFYEDGTTRVGVFFDDQHRVLLTRDNLPPAFAFAIVASEDGAFWSHYGIDPIGITRAMGQNVAAGRVVAGGSTLSQQTAKNVFVRPDRSLKSKLGEGVNTLRLEAHYDKLDILTFYANQFYVTGNGRGLGIAGRYFFDTEDPEKLSVLQCAYIAGLVKGPSNYDPWIGDAERRGKAKTRAHERTRYVLGRIVHEDAANLVGPYEAAELEAVRTEAQRLLDDGFELPFRRGSFRYDRNVVLDEVARRLAAPPFAELLAEAGIEHPQSAGLKVVTSLDEVAQRESTYGLWHHLSDVGGQLEALTIDNVVLENRAAPSFRGTREIVPHKFHTARVMGNGPESVFLDLGGAPCTVDKAGIERVATIIARGAKANKKARSTRSDRQAIVEALPTDTVVRASVREVGALGPVCDLELRPKLQGGVAVVQDGMLRAMVGGSDNRDFNRARAGRQLGSTFKPLVYHAAIELGWRPEEMLDNWQNVFPYGTVFYYPSADHVPEPEVTMAMAGVRSENVSSVWLLYHMLDRLDGPRMKLFSEELGLAPLEGEAQEAFTARMLKEGITLSASRSEEASFFKARHALRSSVDTWSHPKDLLAVDSLLYGWGFEAEWERAEQESSDDREWKHRVLDHSWKAKWAKLERCETQHRALAAALERREVPDASAIDLLSIRMDDDSVSLACGIVPEDFAAPTQSQLQSMFGEPEQVVAAPKPVAATAPKPVPASSIEPRGKGRKHKKRPKPAPEPTVVVAPKDPFHQPWVTTPVPTMGSTGGNLPSSSDMWVDGRIHAATLRALHDRMEPIEGSLYLIDNLVWFQDYRVRVALEYVAKLAETYGVDSELVRVLPLPLGASEITIEEAATMYNGLVTGQERVFGGVDGKGAPVEPPSDPTGLILKITDAAGTVLYEARPTQEERVDAQVGEMLADILRSVVENGTGRRAYGAAKAGKVDVPLGGKTGTTNNFRNAAFLGYAPTIVDGEYSLEHPWAIGVYVGYDDNQAMRKGNIVLAGASGALPTWVHIARGLAEGGRLGTAERRPEDSRIQPTLGLVRAEGPDERMVLTWDGTAPGYQPPGWEASEGVAAPTDELTP
jgi:penicillin-binding protein 1A